MAEWVYVENNEIKEFHDLLPMSWKHVSGLRMASGDLPFLAGLGWLPVTKEQVPYDGNLQTISDYSYSIREADVLETPVVVDRVMPDPEQLKAEFLSGLRAERNLRLAACDWTQLVDVQAAMDDPTKTRWVIYRQALRDLPEVYQVGNINWPEF